MNETYVICCKWSDRAKQMMEYVHVNADSLDEAYEKGRRSAFRRGAPRDDVLGGSVIDVVGTVDHVACQMVASMKAFNDDHDRRSCND